MAETLVITDASLAAPGDPGGPPGPRALALRGDTIAWTGSLDDLPAEFADGPSWSAGGRLVTPGLVDCHTHLLFGGDRRAEYAARAAGATTYRDQLAGADTGIRATVATTAATDDEALLEAAERRARWLMRSGVTTLEVKTGYGLEPQAELRLLRLAHRLRERLPVRVRITLLAGHVYPTGVDRDDDEETADWAVRLCEELLPAAQEIGVDAVEVYLEDDGGLTLDDASTILETAYKKKTPTRLQTDHLSDSAGASLATAFYAKAVAHLNFPDEAAIGAMAAAGTTAVLLPGSVLELGEKDRPAVAALRAAGVPMAVATGLNPGTSPLASLTLAAHLAVTVLGLSPGEALAGITVHAAAALGLTDGTGTLRPGTPADISVWDAEHPEEIVYWAGASLVHAVWSGGRQVEGTP
ncbi:imidazolonepropionase [Actinomycetospora sp. NBRC 106375]|uniref:imidazolonepropionase n=1 Tax=Actinomycetospora sp. NBRC 106375 TaxID=3032207 RepID=UPI0024A5820B|nr:imidazolonepropionase [Actinomycetospora sp. NBRC 106375]GLZ50124.1 imidazolonepropionase [Actinomycetospora sp. NBRC 106375]